VIHFTVSGNYDATLDYLVKPNKDSASAHFLVGRATNESELHPGSVVQLVDLDDVAHHAGSSFWDGQKGVNFFSVGIEINNLGPLTKRGAGFRDNYGHIYCYATPDPTPRNGFWWEPFSAFQYEQTAQLCVEATRAIPTITQIVGHSDVSPKRKIDPGPAWDWNSFRKLVTEKSIV